MQNLNQINKYLLKKKEQIIIEKDQNDILAEKVNPNIVLGLLANLDTWGYTVDRNLIPKLFDLSEDTLVHKFYEPLVETLKEIKGDDVSYENMLFKNFPDSCRNIEHEELSNMRFVGYFTGVLDYIFDKSITHDIPWDGEKEDRKEAAPISVERLRIISEGTLDDFESMIRNMLQSKAALSPFDKAIIEFALKSEDIDNRRIIPMEIPYKENWAFLFQFAFDNPDIKIPMEFRNFNDFVRGCVALSGGDISLSTKPELRSFKNQERIRLLDMLDRSCRKYPEAMRESMMSPYNQRFIGNVLQKGWHMNSNYQKYVRTLNKVIEQAEKGYSKRAKVEMALEQGRFVDAAKLAESISSGELARRANYLLTNCKPSEEKDIMDIIGRNLRKVDISVLLNLKNTVEHTNKEDVKVAFPKGVTAYAHAFENKRAAGKQISPMIKDELVLRIYLAIVEQLRENKPLGKIYVDERLKHCPVPFSSRNANGENRCAERGTSFELNKETKVIRAFCYKQIKNNPNFVDLSVSFLNRNFDLVEQCSWTNLQTNEEHPMAVHSGDNPNCSNGFAEFIDIDLEQLKTYAQSRDINYAAFHVLSWGYIPFSNMDRCFFGIMERESVASDLVSKEDLKKLRELGFDNVEYRNYHQPIYYYHLTQAERDAIGYKQEKVFDPASVEYRNDIKGNGVANVPMIYDVKNDRFIIADIECRGNSPFIKSSDKSDSLFKATGSSILSVENLHGATAQACYAIVNMEKPNMYDLAMYNVAAKGEITDNIEEADTIFTMTKDNLPELKEGTEVISIYDREVITADMLIANKEPEIIREEVEK